MDTLGVRIPNSWFKALVKEIGIPIITTSANLSGKKYMTSLDDLDADVRKKTDFIIYEGRKAGKPSRIIDLTGKPKAIKR